MTSETFKLRYLAASARARVATRQSVQRDWAWPMLMAGLVVAGLIVAAGLTTLAQEGAAPVRLLGDAVPASIREVRYSSTEWFGMVARPSYYLKFRADFPDVTQMLGRGGFESLPPSQGWAGPGWWEPTRAWASLQHFRRTGGECGVERVWWDPQTGEVLYLRYCP